MLHEHGTLYALQPTWIPSEVLSQANELVFGRNKCLCVLRRLFHWSSRIAKKQCSSHLVPWGVDCLKLARESALNLGSASLTILKALQVMLLSPSFLASVNALVDSGLSDCSVDSIFVSKNCLPLQKIKPCSLTLIDRTINQLVSYVVSLPINFPCSYSCWIEFFMMKLEGTYPIVLGHNWLTQHNPTIDWAKGTIGFVNFNSSNWPIDPRPALELRGPPLVLSPTPKASLTHPEPKPSAISPNVRKPRISLVNAAMFVRACKSNRVIGFQINSCPTVTTGFAMHTVDPSLEVPGLLEEYREYRDVFSAQRAKSLPEHWPHDLTIQIENNKAPPLGPIYSLSILEL